MVIIFYIIATILFNPNIAVATSYIYIAYQDDTPGNYEVFLKKVDASSGDVAWRKRITWTSKGSWEPAIIGYNGYIYIAYYDDTPGNAEIFLKKVDASNGNVVWRKRITWTSGASWEPAVVAYNGYIYIAYADNTPGNWEVFLKKVDASNGNVAWRKRITWTLGNSLRPAIAAYNGYIYIAYDDCTPGNWEVFLKKVDASNGNVAWRKRITWTSGNSYRPAIAAYNGYIYIAYYDNTPGNWEVFLKKVDASNGNVAWRKRITWTSKGSYRPAIAAYNGYIYIAYYEDYAPGNYEVFLKKVDASNGDVVWRKRITWTSGNSYEPAIAAYNGYIYIAYYDNTPGNWEVFLKKVDASSGDVAWRKRITWTSGASRYPAITYVSGTV